LESELTRPQREALKEIWRRTPEPGDCARTGDLALVLGVSPATATSMVKRMTGQGLVTHVPYRGVTLSPTGRKLAAAVVRRHRIVERFLADVLGYSWSEADRLAPVFEHDLPQEVEDRLFVALGRPADCPHGFPIPGEGADVVPQLSELYDLAPGQRAVVALSSSVNPAMVAFLGEMGLVPGAEVEVVDKQPFGGPLVVRVAGQVPKDGTFGPIERVLGERAGRQVRVRMLAPGPQDTNGAAATTAPSAPLGDQQKEKA
jgi:DtxR family transcriptional regulator, Mn-dependent transcriptional regulator